MYGSSNHELLCVLSPTPALARNLKTFHCLQIGLLRGVSYVSFFRYTINAFISLQYAARDDGCGVMPDVTPQQRQAAAAAVQVSAPSLQHLFNLPPHPRGNRSAANLICLLLPSSGTTVT